MITLKFISQKGRIITVLKESEGRTFIKFGNFNQKSEETLEEKRAMFLNEREKWKKERYS